jgi:uncharacterized protein (TIGR02300 family)
MAKPELGVKRTCQSCGAKYYDLMRDPITCPKCGAQFVATALLSSAAIARAARADARKKPDEDEDDVEAVVVEDEDAEAISLEDADEETVGATKKAAPGVDEDDDVEIEDDDEADDESFLEADEGDEDVTDIIGDREKDDEA